MLKELCAYVHGAAGLLCCFWDSKDSVSMLSLGRRDGPQCIRLCSWIGVASQLVSICVELTLGPSIHKTLPWIFLQQIPLIISSLWPVSCEVWLLLFTSPIAGQGSAIWAFPLSFQVRFSIPLVLGLCSLFLSGLWARCLRSKQFLWFSIGFC